MKSGKEIIKIDGEKIEDIIKRCKQYMYSPDGYITTLYELQLNLNFPRYIMEFKGWIPGETIEIVYSDNQLKKYEIISPSNDSKVSKRNEPYFIKELPDDIVHFRINEMSLSDEDMDVIKNFFINTNIENKSIILDLRFNFGGADIVGDFIYSFFTETSFYTEIERKVNSNGFYDFFKYSEDMIIKDIPFRNYKKIKGREGYYLLPEDAPSEFTKIEPQLDGHFDGDVYVLTNASTGSAAVQFASYYRNV